jgi:hypothetical protein
MENIMQVPSMLQGDSGKRLVQGAFVGAIATIIVGFNWGGWTLASTAAKAARDRADAEVANALAPICVDQFRHAANASERFEALSKLSYSWDRDAFIEKGGWAVMPGGDKADPAVVKACAEKIGLLKAADLR